MARFLYLFYFFNVVLFFGFVVGFSCDEIGFRESLQTGGEVSLNCTIPTAIALNSSLSILSSVTFNGNNLVIIQGDSSASLDIKTPNCTFSNIIFQDVNFNITGGTTTFLNVELSNLTDSIPINIEGSGTKVFLTQSLVHQFSAPESALFTIKSANLTIKSSTITNEEHYNDTNNTAIRLMDKSSSVEIIYSTLTNFQKLISKSTGTIQAVASIFTNGNIETTIVTKGYNVFQETPYLLLSGNTDYCQIVDADTRILGNFEVLSGGNYPSYALVDCSPAINAAALNSLTPQYDQNGISRNSGGSPDAGAVESTGKLPCISITPAVDPIVQEGDDLIITVSISGKSVSPISIDFSTIPGTASPPDDFSAKNGTVTIKFPNTSKTVSISTLNNGLYEEQEFFEILWNFPVNATLLLPSSNGSSGSNNSSDSLTTTVTILNSDPIPEVFFNRTTMGEFEDVGSVELMVHLSSPSALVTTVPFIVIPGTAKDSGPDTDYIVQTSSPLVFPPGETAMSIQVQIIFDTLVESDEYFTVVLETPTNAILFTYNNNNNNSDGGDNNNNGDGGNNNTTTTIDPDNPPSSNLTFVIQTLDIPSVYFNAPVPSILHENSTVNITARMSLTCSYDVYVNFTVEGDPNSYELLGSNQLIFSPGTQQIQVLILLLDNDIHQENSSKLSLSISDVVNGTIGNSSAVTVEIVDNDPQPTVFFPGDSQRILNEDSTEGLRIAIQLTNPTEYNVTAQLGLLNTSDAIPGTDFNISNLMVSFSPLETLQYVTLFPIIDPTDTGDRTANLAIVSSSNAFSSPNHVTVRIRDDGSKNGLLSTGAIIGISIGALLVIGSLIVVVGVLHKRKRRNDGYSSDDDDDIELQNVNHGVAYPMPSVFGTNTANHHHATHILTTRTIHMDSSDDNLDDNGSYDDDLDNDDDDNDARYNDVSNDIISDHEGDDDYYEESAQETEHSSSSGSRISIDSNNKNHRIFDFEDREVPLSHDSSPHQKVRRLFHHHSASNHRNTMEEPAISSNSSATTESTDTHSVDEVFSSEEAASPIIVSPDESQRSSSDGIREFSEFDEKDLQADDKFLSSVQDVIPATTVVAAAGK